MIPILEKDNKNQYFGSSETYLTTVVVMYDAYLSKINLGNVYCVEHSFSCNYKKTFFVIYILDLVDPGFIINMQYCINKKP